MRRGGGGEPRVLREQPMLDRSARRARLAREALDLCQLPVQIDDPGAARLLVQAIDVLGDEQMSAAKPFEAGEGAVSLIGQCLMHAFEAHEAARPVAAPQRLA